MSKILHFGLNNLSKKSFQPTPLMTLPTKTKAQNLKNFISLYARRIVKSFEGLNSSLAHQVVSYGIAKTWPTLANYTLWNETWPAPEVWTLWRLAVFGDFWKKTWKLMSLGVGISLLLHGLQTWSKRQKTRQVFWFALKKLFLLVGCGFFVSDVISGGLFGHFGPVCLALGANC